jgi:NTE family protein
MGNVLGLVMTGGGARGAYQAGVLKRIGEIKRARARGNPFPIIGAASAGAINGSALAAGSDNFASTTALIAQLWSGLQPSDVFRCDIFSQAANSFAWILDLSFGAIIGGGNAHSLIDATPLRHFLSTHLHCERIDANIKQGHFYALAVSATNYTSGKSYLFIQGKKGHPMWTRSRRVTLDGCVRLQQPLSPVIRLGANRIMAIGVRCENLEHQKETGNGGDPSIAQVMGVLLNAIFLDHLASDIEHLERLNQLLADGHISQSGIEGCERMRPLKSLLITPSVNLSQVAQQHQKSMPYLIEYFVRSLGRDAVSCSDLMSYLLFTSKYTNALIEIGYGDAGKRIDEIEQFLYSTDEGTKTAARAK